MTRPAYLATVLCCLVGLVVAAAASPAIGLTGGNVIAGPTEPPPTPAPGGGAAGGGGGTGGGDGTGAGGDGTGGGGGTGADGDTAPGAGTDGDGGAGPGGERVERARGEGCRDDGEPCRFELGRRCPPGVECQGEAGYTLEITPDPVPGRRVTVHLAADGEPMADVGVAFNRPDGSFRTIGRTDEAGRVSGRVPYVERLVVQLRFPGEPGATARAGPRDVTATEETAPAYVSMGLLGTGAGPGDQGGGPVAQREDPGTRTPENGTAVDLPTDVDVEAGGDRLPGENVTIQATIDGVPVRNAHVTVDGDRAGQTDDEGRFQFQLPEDGSVETTVRITRGAIEVSETIRVRVLDLRVRSRNLLVLPGSDVVVTTLVAGEPEPGVRVFQDGQFLGTTDADGQIDADVAWTNQVSFRAHGADQTITRTVGWLYARLGLVIGLPLAVLTGLVLYARRRLRGGVSASSPSPSRIARLFGVLPARLAALLHAAVTGITERSIRLGVFLRAVGARVIRTVQAAVRALETADWSRPVRQLREWWETARAWLGRRQPRRAVLRVFGRVGGAVLAILGALRAFSWADLVRAVGRVFWRREDTPDEDGPDTTRDAETTPEPSEPAEDGLDTPPTLQELWRRFARRVAPGRWQRSTPGEVARTALDRDLPAESVERLTEAFRLAEYAPESPDDDHQRAARRAYDRLETAMGEDTERTP